MLASFSFPTCVFAFVFLLYNARLIVFTAFTISLTYSFYSVDATSWKRVLISLPEITPASFCDSFAIYSTYCGVRGTPDLFSTVIS